MEDRPAGPRNEGSERFTYFMIRLRAHDGEGPGSPCGIIERLGSGRKQPFAGVDELVRLLADRLDAPVKMRADGVPGNEQMRPPQCGRARPAGPEPPSPGAGASAPSSTQEVVK